MAFWTKSPAGSLAHIAAVDLAISVAHLPRSTAIILQSKSACISPATDILVKAPGDADYTLLARVWGVDVTFVDVPAARAVLG
jgi:hypothetical protein